MKLFSLTVSIDVQKLIALTYIYSKGSYGLINLHEAKIDDTSFVFQFVFHVYSDKAFNCEIDLKKIIYLYKNYKHLDNFAKTL